MVNPFCPWVGPISLSDCLFPCIGNDVRNVLGVFTQKHEDHHELYGIRASNWAFICDNRENLLPLEPKLPQFFWLVANKSITVGSPLTISLLCVLEALLNFHHTQLFSVTLPPRKSFLLTAPHLTTILHYNTLNLGTFLPLSPKTPLQLLNAGRSPPDSVRSPPDSDIAQ